MPELPEVEVTRRSLLGHLPGSRILAVRMGKPLRWPLGMAPEGLVGRQVQDVRRRGKYLLLDLDQGVLVVHLGMSGRLRMDDRADMPPWGPHDHFELDTTQGVLRLNDPRRFGAVVYAESAQAPVVQKLLGHLGMEPLADGCTPESLGNALGQRRAAIKQVLLSGDVVVGVGNIYASEALFRARIHPEQHADRLTRPQVRRLWEAIRDVLQHAIEAGGSTLRDFASPEGRNGHFQLEAMVYGREGEPCRVCGTPIRMVRQGQRSTYFCALCQRRR